MIFKSHKIIANKRLVSDVPFDPELIKNVKRDEDDNSIITFTYNLENVKTYFPYLVSNAFFVAQLTHDNLYLSAAVSTIPDDSQIECPYSEHSIIDYSILLNEVETNKLLMEIIRDVC